MYGFLDTRFPGPNDEKVNVLLSSKVPGSKNYKGSV
jgi:hypothetical protein